MHNQLMTFEYENNNVEFHTKENGVVIVNATTMAKIYDKRISNFFESAETKKFIDACLKTSNKSKLKIQTEDDLYSSTKKSGTWMHRVLALKFAAWLSPDFELWVYYTIDQIIEGEFGEMREYKEEMQLLERDKQQIETEFNLNYNKLLKNAFFVKHLDLDKQLRAIRTKITNLKNKASNVILGKNLFSEIDS